MTANSTNRSEDHRVGSARWRGKVCGDMHGDESYAVQASLQEQRLRERKTNLRRCTRTVET